MTNKLEKQFFDMFGIEPKKQCYYWDCPYSTGNIANNTAMNERDCNSCKNPDKEIYPQITDHILLELICILTKYYDYADQNWLTKCSDAKELKVSVLRLLSLCTSSVIYKYKDQVQALFKEDNE